MFERGAVQVVCRPSSDSGAVAACRLEYRNHDKTTPWGERLRGRVGIVRQSSDVVHWCQAAHRSGIPVRAAVLLRVSGRERNSRPQPGPERRSRTDHPTPQETLTLLEVAQLLEFLEQQQQARRGALGVAAQSTHFRAVRGRCLVLLLVLTGAPAGEVCGMQLPHIDFGKRLIRITVKGSRVESPQAARNPAVPIRCGAPYPTTFRCARLPARNGYG